MTTKTTHQLLLNYDSRFTLQYIYGDKFHSTIEYTSRGIDSNNNKGHKQDSHHLYYILVQTTGNTYL
jgi:hypothetical protein